MDKDGQIKETSAVGRNRKLTLTGRTHGKTPTVSTVKTVTLARLQGGHNSGLHQNILCDKHCSFAQIAMFCDMQASAVDLKYQPQRKRCKCKRNYGF